MTSKTEKETIPYEQLLGQVQDLLQHTPECHDIHIDGIAVFREQVNGANWDIERIRRSGADNDWPDCRETISAAVQQLRMRYDVEAP